MPFKKGDRVRRERGGSFCDVHEGKTYVVASQKNDTLYLDGFSYGCTAAHFDLVSTLTTAERRAEQLALVAEKEELLRQTQESIAKAKALLAELDTALPEPGEVFKTKSLGRDVRVRSVQDGFAWLCYADQTGDNMSHGFIRELSEFKGKHPEYTRVS